MAELRTYSSGSGIYFDFAFSKCGPESQARRLAHDIAASRLVMIEDGAHFLPLDTPDPVAHEINAFLTG